MLFLAAIDKLSRDELVEHVANLEALKWSRVARELTEKKTKEIQYSLQNGLESTLRWVSDFGISNVKGNGKVENGLRSAACKLGEYADKVEESKEGYTWDPYEVSREIERCKRELGDFPDDQLKEKLIACIAKLAGYKSGNGKDFKQLAEDALEKAAGIFKDSVKIKFTLPEVVEKNIFIKYVERMLDTLKEKLNKEDTETAEEIESKLREELSRLSSGDAELLKNTLGLSELTASNILNLLKKGGITAGLLLAADATGFGIFLFLTTMIKSISLLLGITFAFSTYTAATATLGFLLGPAGGILLVGGTVFVSITLMQARFNNELLAGEIFALHCKLLESTGSMVKERQNLYKQ